ncbi:MAG: type I methionyl aminopeptidase [Clostridia bacterium]|jgi:methionyl aminopeptidase|nr:type I methionyl aminopeptidase [Clostridia bacterium]
MITIKSHSEIMRMIDAGKVLQEVFALLHEKISPGISTKDIDKFAKECIIKNGALPSFLGVPNYFGGIDFPGAVCASVNEELIHGIPGDKILKEGDIVSVDVGAVYRGLQADAARTYMVGNVSEEAARLVKVTEECFFKALEQCEAGNRITDISGAVQDHAEANGYSVVRDYTGHGIGREMHEDPEVPNFRSARRGPRLTPGMAIAIEPMINAGGYEVEVAPNKWTVLTKDRKLCSHYENTVIITAGEPIVTTL